MTHRIYLIMLVTAAFFCSCGSADQEKAPDCFAGLTNDEKQLLESIKKDMLNTKKHGIDKNSTTFDYVSYVYNVKGFTPITPEYASMLQKNYDGKRGTIERGYRNLLRLEGTREADTKSVWIPVDELFPFITQLVKYEIDHEKLTGLNMVFGSYPYDRTRDNMMTGAIRNNSDSLSGRTTLYFVGTADTTKQTTYNVKRHKELPKLITGVGVMTGDPDSYNHGTLCPDSCVAH